MKLTPTQREKAIEALAMRIARSMIDDVRKLVPYVVRAEKFEDLSDDELREQHRQLIPSAFPKPSYEELEQRFEVLYERVRAAKQWGVLALVLNELNYAIDVVENGR